MTSDFGIGRADERLIVPCTRGSMTYPTPRMSPSTTLATDAIGELLKLSSKPSPLAAGLLRLLSGAGLRRIACRLCRIDDRLRPAARGELGLAEFGSDIAAADRSSDFVEDIGILGVALVGYARDRIARREQRAKQRPLDKQADPASCSAHCLPHYTPAYLPSLRGRRREAEDDLLTIVYDSNM